MIEKEEFESQLADKEAAEEELQKQKEEAENEVFRHIFSYNTHFCIRFIVYKYNNDNTMSRGSTNPACCHQFQL